jgi:hypothetical protein
LQSYYKLTDEDIEEITKEWSTEFLVLVKQTELSNLNIIRILVVTREEYDEPSSSKNKKNNGEVQEISNASKESSFDSLGVGGNEVNQEEEGEEDK